MIHKTQFGLLYRRYREKTKEGLTQEAMGRLLDKSPSYISKIESGKLDPSWKFLQKSMEIFGLTEQREQENFIACAFACSKRIDFPISDVILLPNGILTRLLARLALNGTKTNKDDAWWTTVQDGITTMLNSWELEEKLRTANSAHNWR